MVWLQGRPSAQLSQHHRVRVWDYGLKKFPWMLYHLSKKMHFKFLKKRPMYRGQAEPTGDVGGRERLGLTAPAGWSVVLRPGGNAAQIQTSELRAERVAPSSCTDSNIRELVFGGHLWMA